MGSRDVRPPRWMRGLARLLIRGADAPHILADLEQLAVRQAVQGGSRWRASLRYLRNALASAVSVWRARGIAGRALTPDVRLALRMLGKNPLMSLVGGLGMAVGIAIGTGFFTFLAFYYSDAPVEEGDRVVTVAYIDGDDDRSSLFDYQLWTSELESMDELAAYRADRRSVEVAATGLLATRGVEMTASGFRVTRVPPALGRTLLDADERPGAPRVVVIGYREWQEGFDGDRDVIGREVRLDGTPHAIVGVMPEGFRLPINHGFWTALETGIAATPESDGSDVRVFGRLTPGVEMAAAEAEASALGDALAAEYPDRYERYQAAVRPYIRHVLDVQQYPGWFVWLLQLFGALVLLVVAVNVAVLVYARTATRRAEITVRTALGASRGRIVTQLFLEALVLALAAAGLGLLIAQVGFGQLTAALSPQAVVPYWLFEGLPLSTIPNAVALAVVAAVVVGVLPALQATGSRIESRLRDLGGSTGPHLGRTWTVLICLQVAVAVGVLPAVLGLAWNYAPPPVPTFAASEVVALTVARASDPGLPEADSVADSAYAALQVELLSRVREVPGVTEVGFAEHLPRQGLRRRIEVEGAATVPEVRSIEAVSHRVGPGYFEAMGVQLLAGELFDRSHAESGAASAIVSRAFVEAYLGNAPALGRRFREVAPGTGGEGAGPSYEIVGVVEDLLRPGRGGPSTPATYHPVHLGSTPVALVARTRGSEPTHIGPRVREVARAVAPGRELGLAVLASRYRSDGREMRFLLLIVGLITTSVLLLSAAGVSAMMSFAVTRRRREIGVRTALGASRGQLFRSIFSRSGRQLGAGLLIGSALAFLLDRTTGGAMLGGEAGPLLGIVATIMLLSGGLATLGPARRAWRTHPMDALREE